MPVIPADRIKCGIFTSLIAMAISGLTGNASGRDVESRLLDLRQRGAEEGWTFTIGETPASQRSMDELCGLEIPSDWPVGAPMDPRPPRLGLPVAFDWRAQGGCPPVRDQGNCGSCWAFGTVGPLECNILIRDGVLVDLSEQWLVSCNRDGYSCSGGWWAHEYHLWQTDPCGGTGAVLEDDFPYVALDVSCACPYSHEYTLDGWAYIGDAGSIPSTAAIKQAILDYGPVSAAVCVDWSFVNYTGGVFNACSSGTVNHAVVLVGWDDEQGSAGVWILRNSWGEDWGEDGYMLIEYGCSSIGYAACYVEYAGVTGPRIEVTPASVDFGNVAVDASVSTNLTIKNVGGMALSGTASGLAGAFSILAGADYTLEPGQTADVTVQFLPTLQGTFVDQLVCSGGGGAIISITGQGVGGGPGNTCASAPIIGDGTFTGSNVGADTEESASCGGGGTADVWWRYLAPATGVAIIDTCGSDFDTVLSVYSTCGGVELACNDDYAECGNNSHLSLNVTASQYFYIRVAGCAVQTGNIVLNVETTIPPQTIAGRIVTLDGDGVAGVTLTGLPGEPVTDEDGNYTATVDYGFVGTVAPRKTAFTFIPGSRGYNNVASDRLAEDYVALLPQLTVSGHVLNEDGEPVSGVLMDGLPGSPVTTLSGAYEATVTLGFSGTITPTKAACTFDPPERVYASIASDLLNEDYLADQETGALQVFLEPQGARVAGAGWQVAGGEINASGTTVTKLPVGTHMVSYAQVSGWTAPLSDQVNIQGDQTMVLERTYTQVTYALNVIMTPSDGGVVVCSPVADANGEYVQDTVVNLTAVPPPGYRVQSWSGANNTPASGLETNTVIMVTDRTVVVRFEVMPFHVYQLSARVADGEGWLEPRRGAYPAGSRVDLIATPAADYQVKQWSGTDDDSLAKTTNTITMDSHKSVSVEFEPWSDCNEDGVSDRLNIADGDSTDCNANGRPDECEPDTDGDGIIDDCDLDWTDLAEPVELLPVTPGAGGGFCGAGIAEALAFTLVGLGFIRRPRT
ncbi:MAG: C1 family peptidase [Planctomycetota bacterium]